MVHTWHSKVKVELELDFGIWHLAFGILFPPTKPTPVCIGIGIFKRFDLLSQFLDHFPQLRVLLFDRLVERTQLLLVGFSLLFDPVNLVAVVLHRHSQRFNTGEAQFADHFTRVRVTVGTVHDQFAFHRRVESQTAAISHGAASWKGHLVLQRWSGVAVADKGRCSGASVGVGDGAVVDLVALASHAGVHLQATWSGGGRGGACGG